MIPPIGSVERSVAGSPSVGEDCGEGDGFVNSAGGSMELRIAEGNGSQSLGTFAINPPIGSIELSVAGSPNVVGEGNGLVN